MKQNEKLTPEELKKREEYADLQKCYQQILHPSPQTEEILKDLAKFCRAFESTFDSDPRVHAVLEGRREVWLRLVSFLQLSTDQLYELYIRRR